MLHIRRVGLYGNQIYVAKMTSCSPGMAFRTSNPLLRDIYLAALNKNILCSSQIKLRALSPAKGAQLSKLDCLKVAAG